MPFPSGIIGRTDDLIILRGVNVYPSAIEAIVRMFEIDEFRMVRTRHGALDELTVEVEAGDSVAADVADTLARAFRERLAVRIPTRVAPAGSLPRWDLKARRVVDVRDG